MEPAREVGGARRRADLQGLRAIAVAVIALNHAVVPGFAGGYVGVDVFFVLSGFLITGVLVRRSGSTEGRRWVLAWFYARRARRILPAAALTLVVVDVAAWLLLDPIAAQGVLEDSIASALFVPNLHFAAQSGYFAVGQPPSPLLHFWSLGVEEQFYLAWPLILMGLFAVGTSRARLRRAPAVGLAVVVLASLAWSMYLTEVDQDHAYFSTLARAWELGLGAGVALAASSLARWERGRELAGWAGLAAIAVATASFSPQTAFPGAAALLPTVGAALVIAAGISDRPTRVARVLGIAPARFVGDRSFAFYLWHWPVLILAAEVVGHQPSGPVRLLLLVAAFALSVVSYAAVENPIRTRSWSTPRPAIGLAAVTIAPVVLIAVVGSAIVDRRYGGPAPTPLIVGTTTPDGVLTEVREAAQQARQQRPLPEQLAPPLPQLEQALYRNPQDCRPRHDDSRSRICMLGQPNADRTLVVFGDSHAEMWMPAVNAMAKRDGWRVVPIHRGSCPPTAWAQMAERFEPCQQWLPWALDQVEAQHPDAILLAGYLYADPFDPPELAERLEPLVQRLRKASPVLVTIGDRPPNPQEPGACLAAKDADLRTCALAPAPAVLEGEQTIRRAVTQAGSRWIDTRGWFCDRELCPTIIGQTVVMRDTSHVTKQYTTRLREVFRHAFRRATAP